MRRPARARMRVLDGQCLRGSTLFRCTACATRWPSWRVAWTRSSAVRHGTTHRHWRRQAHTDRRVILTGRPVVACYAVVVRGQEYPQAMLAAYLQQQPMPAGAADDGDRDDG
jgi:hypothetical protein